MAGGNLVSKNSIAADTGTASAFGERVSLVAGSHVDVAILGAGFAGLCMAIKLQATGHHDFVVFEKAAGIGGTWRDNTYPGCACDVPAHLYSYSFAQNPNWSRTYASQPEILAYLENVATRTTSAANALQTAPGRRTVMSEACRTTSA